jgi:hypothetical protein
VFVVYYWTLSMKAPLGDDGGKCLSGPSLSSKLLVFSSRTIRRAISPISRHRRPARAASM